MKGEGLEGVSSATYIFWNDFFWKPFRITPWLLKRVLHLVWDSYYVYIVVEVTLNMAKWLAVSVNFEPIIRGLKSDIFEV